MMIEDLTGFIQARLDEDEAAATGAAESLGQWITTYRDVHAAEPQGSSVSHVATGETGAIAQHIARHDPARALAEIDAKRRILDLHPYTSMLAEQGETSIRRSYCIAPGQPIPDRFRELFCEACHVEDGVITGKGYCETVRLLASPYADHDGYRDEWRA